MHLWRRHRRRERVIAADVANTAFMAGTADQEQLLAAGIRAAQTTPLISRRGELVGMITTHWKEPHEPSERDLRLLDILARLAADLIERKTQDEEARRREERLRILTQLLTDVPWQARSDGAFAKLQLAWENYTGQSWDQHAGHGWFDAIHPDDRAAVQTSWSAACFAAQPYECRARLWHAASQEYRQCLIRATPIRNEDGSVREWVGSCTEVAPASGRLEDHQADDDEDHERRADPAPSAQQGRANITRRCRALDCPDRDLAPQEERQQREKSAPTPQRSMAASVQRASSKFARCPIHMPVASMST